MYLIETIEDYFNNVKPCCPVSTEDVFKYAQEYYPDLDKAVFNEYMTRVCKRDPLIKRYQRGMYYKTEMTDEGYADIRVDALLKKSYLGSGENVNGYLSGPSLMYKLGMTTQVYEDLVVVSNNYRSMVVDFDNVYLLKPIIPVNKDNYKYLQVLDILQNKWKVKLKPNYLNRLYKFVVKNNLDFKKLLIYSLNYTGSKLQRELAFLAKEEDNI